MLSQDIIDDFTTNSQSKIILGRERILKVLELLDNPQKSYKTIHIAGTNGKGSVATFIATGLIHAGFRVGKFTSPHIYNINETITLNNQNISDLDLTKSYYLVKEVVLKNKIQLSPFELLTAVMFNYFASISLDYLVLEVGLGGLNDATNVVDSIISIITNIGLEHTHFLGNNLISIASEKVGIIKPNSYVILGSSQVELLNQVKLKTQNYINIFDEYDFDVNLDYINFKTNLILYTRNLEKNYRNIKLSKDFELSLFGKFQAYNFLCAYTALRTLNIDNDSICFMASNTYIPCRMQLLPRSQNINTNIIMDATHNASGAEQLYLNLAEMYPSNEVIIITSILKDKDVPLMLNFFSRIANSIIFTSISNTDRALNATQLAQIALNSKENHNPNLNSKSDFLSIEIIDNPHSALKYATTLNKKLIIITGSFYLLNYYNNTIG